MTLLSFLAAYQLGGHISVSLGRWRRIPWHRRYLESEWGKERRCRNRSIWCNGWLLDIHGLSHHRICLWHHQAQGVSYLTLSSKSLNLNLSLLLPQWAVWHHYERGGHIHVDRCGRCGTTLLEGLHVWRGIPLCELGTTGGHCHGFTVHHRGCSIPVGHCLGLHTLLQGWHRLHTISLEITQKQNKASQLEYHTWCRIIKRVLNISVNPKWNLDFNLSDKTSFL